MKFKRNLSLLLVCIMVFCFSNISIASTQNTNNDTNDIKEIDSLKIEAKNIQTDTTTPIQKEDKDGKTIIHAKVTNSISKSKDAAYSVSMDTDQNNAPIADLRYSILNPSSLTSDGYLTTNTQVAWLWSYNGTNFTYDPDGDAITNIEVGGIPSNSIISYATDENNNIIGFIVKIPTPGNYTMTFRCQDEHGAWSNMWNTTFYVANALTKAIACGRYHTAALKEDGTVWTWGSNEYGQLGDGTTVNRYTPVKVTGLTGVKNIVSGFTHTVALKEDGTVWTWGSNEYGQLGDGTTVNRLSPIQVANLSGVKAIACELHHIIALKEDGTVWAWGCNTYGQLGNGTSPDRYTPVKIAGLSGIKAIAGGYHHTAALKEDGTVWTWGLNSDGELGDGTKVNRFTPIQVAGLSGVKEIGCGAYHTVALKEDGTVWAWGEDYNGELGDGPTSAPYKFKISPVQVTGLTEVKSIVATPSHTKALKEDGTVWAWGANWYGILGDGTTANRYTPVEVTVLSNIKVMAIGGDCHTAALKEDGTVWTWGSNEYGQLGDGTVSDSSTPVQVVGLNQ